MLYGENLSSINNKRSAAKRSIAKTSEKINKLRIIYSPEWWNR